MACCKSRKRPILPQTPECKNLEYAGSGFRLWPVIVSNGVQVTVATDTNGYVELGSFLRAFRCDGTVARMLLRYLPDIQRVALQNPGALRPYSRTGISMADLLRIAAPPRSSVHGQRRG